MTNRSTTPPPAPRPVKYTFDTVFGETAPSAPAASRTRSSYSADEVERIRAEAASTAKADVETQAVKVKADAMNNIGAGLAQLLRAADDMQTNLRVESVELALAVAKKLAEASLNAFPLLEIQEVVTDCLHKLHREPRLVVRVPEPVIEALQAEIHGLADRHGFAGRIVILPEQSLRGADCRVEWAGGGLERDFDTNLAAIDEAVARWRTLIEAEK